MNGKLISIVVTAYNIEKYLPRCLDSIIAQTYTNLQVIVVDDGSSDGTGEICDRYAMQDTRFKAIHQANLGPSSARNAGLKFAIGSYVGFVDGDDWIEPEMYQGMYNACESDEAEIACCAYRQIGGKEENATFSNKRFLLTGHEALEIYICDNREFHIYNSVWSKLFRRDIVERLEFIVGRKSEDIMYTTRALAQAVKCVFIDKPYYNYMTNRTDSIMNADIADRRFKDEIPFWKEQTGYLYGLGMKELGQKAAYQYYRRMLFYYVDFRKRKMRDSADQLVSIIRTEKREIKSIYSKDFVKTGDKMRMRLFLKMPKFYFALTKLYDSLLVPLKQKK